MPLAAQIDSVRTRPLKAKTALWRRVMTGWGTERRRWVNISKIYTSKLNKKFRRFQPRQNFLGFGLFMRLS